MKKFIKNWKNILIVVLSLIIIVGLVLFLTSKEEPSLENGAQKVVTLNDGNITADELYESLKSTYGIAALIDLVDKEIFNNMYEETDEEKEYINSQVEQIKTSAEQNEVDYNTMLEYYGFSSTSELEDYLKLSYRKELAINEYIVENLKEKEIEKYYEDEIYGDIKVKHILIAPDITDDMTTEEQEEEKEKALTEAKNIIKKIKDGEDFDKLAEKYSDDSATAEDGGSLGWISTGDMVDEFNDAAFALEKGKYTTSPIETTYGYHIIYKVDEKEKPSLEDSRDDIITNLTTNKLNEDPTLYYETLEKIREEAGLKFEDSTLKKDYKSYMADLKEQAINNASNSQQ